MSRNEEETPMDATDGETRVASSGDRGSRPGRPNVVFMMGDIVGWGDIGCYGGQVPTPRMDTLAARQAFLAGEGASYMTATTAFADGGIMHSNPGL